MQIEELALRLESLAAEARAGTTVDRVLGTGVELEARELTTVAEVHHAIENLQHRATLNIDWIDTPEHDDQTFGQCIAQPPNLARGIRYRVVYHPDEFSRPELLSGIRAAVMQGELARVSRVVSSRVLIRDSEEALILAHNYAELTRNEATEVLGILTRAPTIVGFAQSAFDRAWEASVPLTFDGVPGLFHLTELERQLLMMLVAGVTDSAAARSLEISERTVQRKLSALQQTFGASGRFQLGARIGMLLAQQQPL